MDKPRARGWLGPTEWLLGLGLGPCLPDLAPPSSWNFLPLLPQDAQPLVGESHYSQPVDAETEAARGEWLETGKEPSGKVESAQLGGDEASVQSCLES